MLTHDLKREADAWCGAMVSSRIAGALERLEEGRTSLEGDKELLSQGLEIITSIIDHHTSLFGGKFVFTPIIKMDALREVIGITEDTPRKLGNYNACIRYALRREVHPEITRTKEFFDKYSTFCSSRLSHSHGEHLVDAA